MTALFPGSFDPVTLGHIDIIHRASKLFDILIVAVMNNALKKTTFTIQERLHFLQKTTASFPNVEICDFSGLLVDFYKLKNCSVIIRGLRNCMEFEHEMQYAGAFKKIDKQIETCFLPSAPEHTFISSSMAKEAAVFGGDLQILLSDVIIDDVKKKFRGILNGNDS